MRIPQDPRKLTHTNRCMNINYKMALVNHYINKKEKSYRKNVFSANYLN